MKTLLLRLFLFIVVVGALLAFLSRGPDFTVTWTREVPSNLTPAQLAPALRDTRNWPIFYHALKTVTFFENGKAVPEFDRIMPGMTAVFEIMPKGREWKRFDIRAEVLEVKPGESMRFRMLEESTGKTTRILDGFEWGLSIRPANEAESKLGHRSFVAGGATAQTKSARARFFGRFSPKILMNQLYQIDLVRLANFEENMESWAGDHAPVYR